MQKVLISSRYDFTNTQHYLIIGMAAASDAALQDLRIRRQENSLLKIQKYEQVADKLINGGLSGK